MRYWRLQAFRIALYLDDGLGMCPSFVDCCSQSLGVKSDLFLAGFVAKQPEKQLGSSAVSSLVGLSLGFKGQFADCA